MKCSSEHTDFQTETRLAPKRRTSFSEPSKAVTYLLSGIAAAVAVLLAPMMLLLLLLLLMILLLCFLLLCKIMIVV